MGPVMVLSEYLLLDLHAVATAFALEVGLAENFKCLEGGCGRSEVDCGEEVEPPWSCVVQWYQLVDDTRLAVLWLAVVANSLLSIEGDYWDWRPHKDWPPNLCGGGDASARYRQTSAASARHDETSSTFDSSVD